MSIREFPCPSCRRLNATDADCSEAACCPRCGCELETLAIVREAAAARTSRAGAALAAGFHTEAAHLTTEAWSLKPSLETAACGLLAGLLRGDLSAVSLWRQRLDHPSKD